MLHGRVGRKMMELKSQKAILKRSTPGIQYNPIKHVKDIDMSYLYIWGYTESLKE